MAQRLSTRQRDQIIEQLPNNFIELYNNSSTSEKITLMATLSEFIDHLGDIKDWQKYLNDKMDIKIN